MQLLPLLPTIVNPCAAVEIEWPYNLQILFQNLPVSFNHDLNTIINRHSNIGLYAPFLPEARYQNIRRAIFTGESCSYFPPKLGLARHRRRHPPVLRCCISCVREDRERFGETYWHRIHQTPGVIICPVHREMLQIGQTFETPRRLGKDRSAYYVAEGECEKSTIVPLERTSQDQSVILEVARDLEWLLRNNRCHPGPSKLADWYRTELVDQKLAASVSQAVDTQAVHDAFYRRFPDSALDALGVSVDVSVRRDWLTRIFQKRGEVQIPLHHVLFMRSLGYSAESFLQKYGQKPAPKRPGPFLCLNPICKCSGRRTIHGFAIKKKQPRAVFRCPECGYTYARHLPLSPQDEREPASVIDVGPHWKAEFRRLWNQPTVSILAMTRKLGFCSKMLRMCAYRMGLRYPRKGMRSNKIPERFEVKHDRKQIAKGTRQKHRAAWEELLKSHPDATRSQLRKLAPTARDWLYRHDRQWVNSKKPGGVSLSGRAQRDWKTLDGGLSKKLEETGLGLLKQGGFPARITIGKLTTEIRNCSSFHYSGLKKLPKTAAAIDRLKDTADSLALRRAKWCDDQTSLPTGWDIQFLKRRMGLVDKSSMSETALRAVAKATEALITRLPAHEVQNRRVVNDTAESVDDFIPRMWWEK